MDNIVYLDNAATTKIKPAVLDEMMPYFKEDFYNPSASYDEAKSIGKAISIARQRIARLINCSPEEIYFTSGGTESDNWALKAVAESLCKKGKHIITSKIEHHAILHTMQWLESRGYEVTYIDVDDTGIIDVSSLEKSIRPDTILISVMTANNEIGTIQPIAKIGAIARKNKILFHTDAVQAYGHISLDVNKMKIDLLSASSHKIHGPKGIGFLYIRKSVKLSGYMQGGSQEHGLRPGTYNVPGIVGFGKAAEIAEKDLSNDSLQHKRDYLISELMRVIPFCRLNGDKKDRLPNNISICISYVDAESLLVLLNQKGILASAGSACTTGQIEPSHVLLALGMSKKDASSTIRMTLSDETTEEEIDYVINSLVDCVGVLRSKSTEYKKAINE